MAEYLDREKVIEAICALDTYGSDDNDTSFLDTGEVWDTIAEIEAADVQEVRHGKWSPQMVARKDDTGDYHFGFECSVCHEIASKTIFCGWCGAIMDGKEN